MELTEKEKQEEENQKKLRRAKIALQNFNLEKELNRQKSYTSFGKLILAREKSEPIFSIGKADRFVKTGELIQIPKDTPGPQYNPADIAYYKYPYSSKWKIGDALRPPLYQNEIYKYYEFKYDEKNDLGKYRKTRIVGGALGLDPRIKYDFREKTPGPGRYEPNYKALKKKYPSYFIGEKIASNSLINPVSTTDVVGPGKYDVEKMKFPSQYRQFPVYSIGKQKRPGLYNKKWTKDETYETYSCMKKQVRSKKRHEPEISMAKSTRDGEMNRGVFRSTMERQPTVLRIPMPKF